LKDWVNRRDKPAARRASFNETKRNQAKPAETRWFEVHQLLAFHTADFAVGLSENAPRSPGATFPRCVNRSQSRLIEAD
jgi:hypothetical protein